MALSKSSVREEDNAARLRINNDVTNAVQTYAGGYAANLAAGTMSPYATTVGVVPLGGQFSDQALGDSSSISAQFSNNLDIADKIWKRIDVTGVASIADLNKPVYFADDETATLTPVANQTPAGVVIGYHSGTTCDVFIFGYGLLRVLEMTMPAAGYNTTLGNQA